MDGAPVELRTERLRLRRWRHGDRAALAALNADPEVMEFLPGALTRQESDEMMDRLAESFDSRGFGLWAVEVTATTTFVGWSGLWPATFAAHFTPAVEVGWRLCRACWGRGYATEAARASVADGFARLDLDEIVSFTTADNRRSRRVMEKLGMSHDPADDF